MLFILSWAWDKVKILSPHEESNPRPTDSMLQYFITVPQMLITMLITSNLLSSINHAKNTPEKALLCYSVLLRQFSWDRLERGMYWNSHAAKLCYPISSALFISQDLTSNHHLMLLYNSTSVSQENLDFSYVTTCSQLLCWMHFKVKYLSCFRQM